MYYHQAIWYTDVLKFIEVVIKEVNDTPLGHHQADNSRVDRHVLTCDPPRGEHTSCGKKNWCQRCGAIWRIYWVVSQEALFKTVQRILLYEGGTDEAMAGWYSGQGLCGRHPLEEGIGDHPNIIMQQPISVGEDTEISRPDAQRGKRFLMNWPS